MAYEGGWYSQVCAARGGAQGAPADQRHVNAQPSDQHSEAAAGGAESLGSRLRRAREARGLTLRALSDQTRISRRHLEAIETDDYGQLPGGIFNRSFIRAYAKAVGFNEEESVASYLRAARERGESPDEVPLRQQSRLYTDESASRSPLVTAFLSLLILTVISLGVYAGLHYYRRTSERGAPQANTPSTAQPAGGQTVPAGSVNQSAPAAAPSAPEMGGLRVRVRAKGEDVWLRTSVDAEPSANGILKAGQEREINAGQNLKLEYARAKAPALEVTVNGRPAVVPSDTKPGRSLVEMLISKDDYERLLQQP